MEFLVDSPKYPNIGKFITGIMPDVIELLGLQNSTSFVTVIVDDDFGDNEGGTLPIYIPEQGLDGYLVTIKPNNLMSVGTAIAHEMVHVRQYARGYLRDLGQGFNLWCDKVFGPETPYLDRPWEQDAFARQEILFRRVLEF